MSRRRALTDEQAAEVTRWFSDYERVGTFSAKARELGVDKQTLRDAIKRMRNEIPRPVRRKLSDSDLSRLVDDISRGTSE